VLDGRLASDSVCCVHLAPDPGSLFPPEVIAVELAGAAYSLGYLCTSLVARAFQVDGVELPARRGGVALFVPAVVALAVAAVVGESVRLLPEAPLSLSGAAAVLGLGPACGAALAWARSVNPNAEQQLADSWGFWIGAAAAGLWLGFWLHGG
jgi:hypothetical protein